MIEVPFLLTSYLEGLRRLTGAEAAALYAPPPPGTSAPPVLVSSGTLSPATLPDLASAESFCLRSEGRRSPTLADSGDAALIPLMIPERGVPLDPRQERRRAPKEPVSVGWLELRFQDPEEASLLLETGPEYAGPSEVWQWAIHMGSNLANHTSEVNEALCDNLTGLPLRTGFQVLLRRLMVSASDAGQPVSLVFVNPIGFAAVNDKIGTFKADMVVNEIGNRLRSGVRLSDVVGRFGGVIFAVALPNTALEDAMIVTSKLQTQLGDKAYGPEDIMLPFGFGVTSWSPEEPFDEQEFLRRATQALAIARRRGGGKISWSEGQDEDQLVNSDQLTDVFTGNIAKDYRNMALLWRGLAIVAQSSDDPKSMAAQVSRGLLEASRADVVRVFLGDAQSLRELTATQSNPDAAFESASNEVLTMARDAIREGKTCSALGVGSDGQTRIRSVTPLVTEKAIGALYLQANRSRYRFDQEDNAFLEAFAKQLALALDRALTTRSELEQSGEERRQLKQEIQELRKTHDVQLVSESSQLRAVLDRLRRVAPTEATVLIEGPSGTGKELLARTVHELSSRSEGPYVVVDCGAMATSVIESELFGHSKGAYTGAESRRAGRLLEANGGTVFLDEIGELPLEVQSKLLRFVQERHFTPVGTNDAKRVDVRIVAATNRDLKAEAAAGRFREDLYYRLSVFSVTVPALVERPDDILPLAEHFLARSAIQLGRRPATLTDRARSALLEYGWPGNVRELQNRILQAMIMSSETEINEEDFGLPARAGVANVSASPPRLAVPASPTVPELPAAPAASSPAPPAMVAPQGLEPALPSESPGLSLETMFERLGQALGAVIDVQDATNLPYGSWLAADLLLLSDERSEGAVRQGARSLGIPMTTYRRRLAKAQASSPERPDTWRSEVHPVLQQILYIRLNDRVDLLRATQDVLLIQVEQRCKSTQTGALWLGVSPPTYRRRVAALIA